MDNNDNLFKIINVISVYLLYIVIFYIAYCIVMGLLTFFIPIELFDLIFYSCILIISIPIIGLCFCISDRIEIKEYDYYRKFLRQLFSFAARSAKLFLYFPVALYCFLCLVAIFTSTSIFISVMNVLLFIIGFNVLFHLIVVAILNDEYSYKKNIRKNFEYYQNEPRKLINSILIINMIVLMLFFGKYALILFTILPITYGYTLNLRRKND